MKQQKNYEITAILPSQRESGFAVVGKTSLEENWQKNPTPSFVRRAYLHPEKPSHIRVLEQVLTGGLNIARKPKQEKSDSSHWSIGWEKEWQRQNEHKSYAHVFEVVLQATTGAEFTDEEYSRITLPSVWKILSYSRAYTTIFAKTSARQGTPVGEHIKLVPEKVDTNDLSKMNTVALRLAAIFHDIMKVCETGGDQVYHSLGGAKLVEDFFDNMQPELERLLANYAPIGNVADKLLPPDGDPKHRFSYLKNQVVQLVRLHHVFEMVDKGLLTSEELREICQKSGVNPSLLARFIVADGLSVVQARPTQEIAERYGKYLAANTAFAVDLCLEIGRTPEVLLTCVALQKLFRELLDKVEGLYEAFQEFLQKNGLVLLELIGSEKPVTRRLPSVVAS